MLLRCFATHLLAHAARYEAAQAADAARSAAGARCDAVRGAIRRGTFTAAHLPERPGRNALTAQEVERYRHEVGPEQRFGLALSQRGLLLEGNALDNALQAPREQYLQPGTLELRTPIAPEDVGLLATYGLDAVRLAAMGAGTLLLSDDDLRAIISRP